MRKQVPRSAQPRGGDRALKGPLYALEAIIGELNNPEFDCDSQIYFLNDNAAARSAALSLYPADIADLLRQLKTCDYRNSEMAKYTRRNNPPSSRYGEIEVDAYELKQKEYLPSGAVVTVTYYLKFAVSFGDFFQVSMIRVHV